MSIPVLIPTRNRPHLLERQIKAIREQEGDFGPLYMLTWQRGNEKELELAHHALDILWNLDVACLIRPVLTPYQGAETKSYNYDHLARLWNRLFDLADKPPWILMGSDVLPREPDTLAQLVHRLIPFSSVTPDFTKESIAVPVPVNESGALNWFWPARRGRREPYRATISNTRLRDAVVPAERITGGIIALNYDPSPLEPGPGSEFFYLKNPSVYLGRNGINIRPGGEEWVI